MRTKKLFLGLCAIAAFSACADNEVFTSDAQKSNEVTGVALSLINSDTRALYDDVTHKFQWNEGDMIGLSMVSRDKEAEITSSDYTLTNYEFTAKAHVGYSYPGPQGWFETENASVFSGKYVAYYPYNENYVDPSLTIPVSSPYIQYQCITEGTEKASVFAGNNTFKYSKPFALNGGKEASAEIELQNLAGFFELQLDQDLSTKFETNGISYIIATPGDFTLGAKKAGAGEFPIKGDLKSVVEVPSDNACNYVESQEALVLHMTSDGKAGGYATPAPLTIGATGGTVNAYMVALPRAEFFKEGYKFYLVDANNKAYEIEKAAALFAGAGITSIKGTQMPLTITNADVVETKVNSANVFVAADYASLKRLESVTAGSQIYVFNNIELEDDVTFVNQVELIAAKNQGKITVAADHVLTLPEGSIINTEIEVAARTTGTTAGLVASGNLTIGTKGVVTNYTDFEVVTEKMVTVEGTYNNHATFTVEAPSATTAEPNRGLKIVADATFTNNNIVDNYGSVSNVKGTFNNKTGAQFLDQVGSKLSGTAIDQQGEFICIVNTQLRLNEATQQRPTTIIRLKNCGNDGIDTGTGSGPYAYKFDGNDWSAFRFEAIENGVIIGNSAASGTTTAKIKSLTVKPTAKLTQQPNLNLEIAEYVIMNGLELNMDAYTTVGEDFIVSAGTTKFASASVNLTKRLSVTGDFSIAIGATVTFENNILAAVNGDNGVTNAGTFIITDATSGQNVPAIVYCNDFTGSGIWANYPTIDPTKLF